MEQSFIAEQKKKLEDMRDKLTAELTEVRGGNIKNEVSVPEYGDDEDENTSEVEAFTTNLSIEHTLEKALRDVEMALSRIADGTYGVCQYCHKPIDERRLLARPSSGACIACKEEMKRRL